MLNAGSEEWWQAAHVDANLTDGPPALIPSKQKYVRSIECIVDSEHSAILCVFVSCVLSCDSRGPG